MDTACVIKLSLLSSYLIASAVYYVSVKRAEVRDNREPRTKKFYFIASLLWPLRLANTFLRKL